MRAGPPTRWIASLLLLGLASCTAPDTPRFTVGAERVYVVNTHGRSVSVIDAATRTEAGRIDLDGRVHGQVPSADGRRLYVTTSGGHGEVIAVDTATHRILWRLDVGESLHQPALTLDDRRLFVPDFARGVVTMLDVHAPNVTRTIQLRHGDAVLSGAHNAHAGAGGRYVYQTSVFGRALVRLDAAEGSIDRVYPLSGRPRPIALRRDESSAYLQMSDLHGVVELDLETGREVRRIEWPVADHPADGDASCHGLGLPPDEAELWATSQVDDDVRILRLPDLATLARIPVGGDPQWVAFSADGRTTYITVTNAETQAGRVAVIDRDNRRLVTHIPVGPVPKRVHSVVAPPAPTVDPARHAG